MMDLETALDLLGDTPDQVAHTLRLAGGKGYPADSMDCPVARWINRMLGLRAIVGGLETTAECVLADQLVPLPRAVADFARAFDHGAYSDLAEPDAVPDDNASFAPSTQPGIALEIGKHVFEPATPP
jgi:hypothetical protein